jgi:hypothetical protein
MHADETASTRQAIKRSRLAVSEPMRAQSPSKEWFKNN